MWSRKLASRRWRKKNLREKDIDLVRKINFRKWRNKNLRKEEFTSIIIEIV